jgi:hypothetical protein
LYIVLKPISPPEGAIIEPAVATADNPTPEPVLVEEGLFSGDTDDERAANIKRLIEQGVIAPFEVPALDLVAPVEQPLDAPSLPRRVARQSEE